MAYTHFDETKLARSAPLTVCVDYGGAAIRLEQYGKDRARGMDCFRVVYGKQIDDELTYSEACEKLGAAIMHHLACEGLVDTRARGKA